MDAAADLPTNGFSRRSALFRLAATGMLVQPAASLWNTADAEENPFATKAPIRNGARDFRVFPKNRKELSREDIVMQRRDFSCGAAAFGRGLRAGHLLSGFQGGARGGDVCLY